MTESTTCPECGAVVADAGAHKAWHRRMAADRTQTIRDLNQRIRVGVALPDITKTGR